MFGKERTERASFGEEVEPAACFRDAPPNNCSWTDLGNLGACGGFT